MAAATTAAGQVKATLAQSRFGKMRWVLLLGFVLAAILEVLDTSIINPVLPTMAGNLGCTTQEIGWVSTAYILANVVILPMTAWFSQRFGLKNYVVISIIVFVFSSVMCGFSHSLGEIIVWRLLQGAAGAPLISMTQAAIAEVFPPHEQNAAIGVWALGISVAPSVAPALGGWIADNYSWPWIFFINVPIGIFALSLIGLVYKDLPRTEAGKVDWLGIGLLTAGLGAIQYVLEEGNSDDWFESSLILRLTILGVVSTAAFVWWQLSERNTNPIVNLRVLKYRGLTSGVLISFVTGIGLYSGIFVFPVFAQYVLGFTATKSGMFMLLPGVVLAAGMIISGVTMEKGVPARDLVIVGLILSIVAMWMMGHLSPQSNESDAQLGLSVRAMGIALILMPITVAAIAGLKGAAIGQGAALLGLARQLGGSIGIAVASTILTQMTNYHRYSLTAKMFSGNVLANERVTGMAGAFTSNGMDADRAHAAALKLLDGLVSQQAYTMAVNNAFIITGVMFLLASPCILLLKRSAGSAPAGAH